MTSFSLFLFPSLCNMLWVSDFLPTPKHYRPFLGNENNIFWKNRTTSYTSNFNKRSILDLLSLVELRHRRPLWINQKRKQKIRNGEKMKLKKVKPLRFLDEKRKTAPIPTATTATATPRSIWFSGDCKKSMILMMSGVKGKMGVRREKKRWSSI